MPTPVHRETDAGLDEQRPRRAGDQTRRPDGPVKLTLLTLLAASGRVAHEKRKKVREWQWRLLGFRGRLRLMRAD